MRGKIFKIQVSTKLLYWPFCLKKYHNLRIILDNLNISSFNYTVSENLKVLLQMVGKQTKDEYIEMCQNQKMQNMAEAAKEHKVEEAEDALRW